MLGESVRPADSAIVSSERCQAFCKKGATRPEGLRRGCNQAARFSEMATILLWRVFAFAPRMTISDVDTSLQSSERSSDVRSPANSFKQTPGRKASGQAASSLLASSGVRAETSRSSSDGFSIKAQGFSAVQRRESAKLNRIPDLGGSSRES
jgi:hypothetical protein